MAKKKEWGERNQELSNLLLGGKKYYDWVVTTAFYSAIHFVEDFILPTEVLGKECVDISDVKSAYKMDGRHAARERLVFDKINSAIGHAISGLMISHAMLGTKPINYSRQKL